MGPGVVICTFDLSILLSDQNLLLLLFNSLSVQQANREKRKDREKDVCTGHHDKTQRYDGIMKS